MSKLIFAHHEYQLCEAKILTDFHILNHFYTQIISTLYFSLIALNNDLYRFYSSNETIPGTREILAI